MEMERMCVDLSQDFIGSPFHVLGNSVDTAVPFGPFPSEELWKG